MAQNKVYFQSKDRYMKKILLCLVCFLLVGCAQFKRWVSNDQVKAAELTSACASNSYLKSHGCSVKAVKMRAESGDADAQYALGYIYYYGSGLKVNHKLAELWIGRAAAQGQVLAKKALPILNRKNHASAVPVQSAGFSPGIKNTTDRKKKSIDHTATIQLMASHDIHSLRLEAKKLGSTHQPVHIYQVSSKIKPASIRYVLTCGEFSDSRQAKLFVKRLPSYWKKNQPWLRLLSDFSSAKVLF